MSTKKDSSKPPFERLLEELGLEEKSDFIKEYEDVIYHMLSICSMKLMVTICKLSQIKYYREYGRLSGLDPLCFNLWTIDEEIETGIVGLSIESDIFGPLKYCFEDEEQYFDLLIERFHSLSTIKKKKKKKNDKSDEEVLINRVNFGSLISEISKAREDNKNFWEEARIIILRRKVTERFHKVRQSGDVRIRNVPSIGSKYWGTPKEASEFAAYPKLIAKSCAFTLAEWLMIYQPFINMTKK